MTEASEPKGVSFRADVNDSPQKKSLRLTLPDDAPTIDDEPDRVSKLYFNCSISQIRCEGLQT